VKIQEVKRVNELTSKYPQLNDDEIKELRLLASHLSKFCTDIISEMEIKD
jgi:hypothetical protein